MSRRSLSMPATLAALALVTAMAAAAPATAAPSDRADAHRAKPRPAATSWSAGLPNPFTSAPGLAAPHSDARSSNSTPQAGPGTADVAGIPSFGSSCPSILIDRADYLVAYCLDGVDNQSSFRYSLRLVDPATTAVLASFALPATGPNGVYPYLDQNDRVVVATGDGHLLRVAHSRDALGLWSFHVAQDVDLTAHVGRYCGDWICDYVVSAKPDWSGRVWFSTTFGVVGSVDPRDGSVVSTRLPAGEMVTKALSTAPTGVAVVSDHALYVFAPYTSDGPHLLWREPYTRGTGVKPGKLGDGSGTAPTFFGSHGTEYVTIVDNAVPQENLLVYRVWAGHRPRLVCSVPLFAPGASAVDNTSIGAGRSVITSNTYGYSYFDFTPVPRPGGLTRVDVRADDSGCDRVWTNPTLVNAIPKLSLPTGMVYTVDRTGEAGVASYRFVAIDAATGQTVKSTLVGQSMLYETLQFNGVVGRDGTFYQGTLTGILRVRPLG